MRPFLLPSNKFLFEISSVSRTPSNAAVINQTPWLHTMWVFRSNFPPLVRRETGLEGGVKELEAKEPGGKWLHGIERWRRKKKKIKEDMGHEQWDKNTSAQREKQSETGNKRNKTANGIKQRQQLSVVGNITGNSEMKVLFLLSALLLLRHRWITLRLTLTSLRAHKAKTHMRRDWQKQLHTSQWSSPTALTPFNQQGVA